MADHRQFPSSLTIFMFLGALTEGINSAYTNQRYGSTPVYRVRPQGSSKRGWYRHVAVAADNHVCGAVATEILRKNGSVVDAGIAAQLCNGVVDQPHMGIGGGTLSLIYAHPRDGGPKEIVYISGDERAPAWMKKDSLDGVPYFDFPYKMINDEAGKPVEMIPYKAISSGVPGELAGYYAAWQRFGKLPWKDIVRPSIAVARKGFPVTPAVQEVLSAYKSMLTAKKSLTHFLTDDLLLYSEGDIMTDPALASTLQKIAEDPTSFYDGELANDIIKDVEDFHGLLTKDDLKNYGPKWMSPLNFTMMGGKYRAYVPGNPYCGELFTFVYNILEGYHMTPDDISTQDGMALFYHRYLEAWKFAYSHIDCIGDRADEYPECVELLKKLVDKSYADEVRQKINDEEIQSTYEPEMSLTGKDAPGTSHLNVFGEDGSVFASTSSVNVEFGCQNKGTRTGILFNNRIADFDRRPKSISANSPGADNSARSFRHPILITDKEGNPVLIMGGSGGMRIISAVMQDMLMHVHFGLSLKEAIDFPRMSAIPRPPLFSSFYDEFDKEIIEKLKARNHPSLQPIFPNWPYTGVVQGISLMSCHGCMSSPANCENPCIEAVSDYRKAGQPDGF